MPMEQGTPREDGAAGNDSPGAIETSLAASLARVDGVPSEQLWRAAIFAARQAAVSAAELRQAFEATRPATGV